MKIFISETHVDLEAPIQMTEDQRQKLLLFLKNRFNFIEIKDVKEVDRAPPGAGQHRNWTVDDYMALLKPNDNVEIAVELDRSEMSIRMQRGNFVADFLSWMKKKNYSIPYTREMIEEYSIEKEYQ
jgi:hypothetical protein